MKSTLFKQGAFFQAERKGFEPPLPSRVNTFSRRAQSSTLPPLRTRELYQLFSQSDTFHVFFLTFLKDIEGTLGMVCMYPAVKQASSYSTSNEQSPHLKMSVLFLLNSL